MFNHIMLGSNDIDRSKAFYDAVLGTLGFDGQAFRNQSAGGQTRLFYRCWQPRDTYRTAASPPLRVLIFLHRGHEHSGRIEPLVEQFAGLRDWAFAWDARGHGHSPGERGAAPDFESLVQDFHWFIRHLRQVHGFAPEDMVVIANSVGAVIAATWIHDHAPHIRGVVMAAA